MARVLRGFAPEPPVVFVILSEAKYLMLCSLGLTPHLNPLPKERKKNINHPYGTQFHKIKFCVWFTTSPYPSPQGEGKMLILLTSRKGIINSFPLGGRLG